MIEQEVGMPEAGYQPSMVEEVPEREVRPKGKGKVVQISMADQLKLAEARKAVMKSYPMESVEELEQELSEKEAHIKGLDEALKGSRVADLTELVSKTGKMKEHLTGLTPRQYEKFIGKKPRPELLVKERDATTKKVPWNMVLDQLTSERGFKSDEELKDAIEKAHKDKATLDKAKGEIRGLSNAIVAKLGEAPEVETVKLDEACPQFPDTFCRAEVTMVNGMKFMLRRQHSYWRIDAEGKSIRVRYASDARKLARIAVKDYKQDIREARRAKVGISRGRGLRITPKTPRLRK